MLQKQCKCGEWMTVQLRTVIYQTKLEIENVPVYSCASCKRSEVYSPVKLDLTEFINSHGKMTEKKLVNFAKASEFANLLSKLSDHDRQAESVYSIIQERINELLDMLLLARTVEDGEWIDELHRKLAQITLHVHMNTR